MKASVPLIAPLLRSDVQGAVLAALLLEPQREYTVTELVAAAESTPPTVHREVERLVDSGFALERRSGRNRYISANVGHRLYRPVKEIIEYAYGPRVVVADALRDVGDVDEAFIYGSWAARMTGESGMDPQDIDVMVIGRPDRGRLISASDAATARLGRDVNIRAVSRERWEALGDAFLRNVRERPLIKLDLDGPR